VEIGREAYPCECTPDTVRMDMSIFDDVCGGCEAGNTLVRFSAKSVPLMSLTRDASACTRRHQAFALHPVDELTAYSVSHIKCLRQVIQWTGVSPWC